MDSQFAGYDQQVFMRLTQAMPHYLLGVGATMLSLYVLARVLEAPKQKMFFYISLFFGVIASMVYAPDEVLLISGFPLYILLDSLSVFIRTRKIRVDWHKVGVLLAYTCVAILPVLYVHYITTSLWSDIQTNKMEFLFPFHIDVYRYVLVLGAAYVFSLVSLPFVIRKGKPFMLILATWLVMHPVGEYVLSPMLHLNAFRYFLTPYYVAFGILGAAGVVHLSGWVHGHMSKIPQWSIAAALTALILATSLGTYVAVWQQEHLCYCLDVSIDFAYPKTSVMDGIFWLSRNSKPDDVVLSSYFTGTFIPAFAGNRVIEPGGTGLSRRQILPLSIPVLWRFTVKR